MPKPTPCQVVTTITETIAARPLPCQSTVGSESEVSTWLISPMSGSKSRSQMMPAATPEMTTGT